MLFKGNVQWYALGDRYHLSVDRLRGAGRFILLRDRTRIQLAWNALLRKNSELAPRAFITKGLIQDTCRGPIIIVDDPERPVPPSLRRAVLLRWKMMQLDLKHEDA